MALSLLASCKEEISMDTLDGSPKLVVYCMPTVGDTTYIGVSRSVPVTKYNNTSKLTRVDNAHIDYTVNGQSIAVEHVGKGYYRVVGRQNAGDKIALKVQADGFESVRAATTIPQPVPIDDLDYNYVRRYNDLTGRQETFDQITGTFRDDPNSHDHYAVRVKIKCYNGKATLYKGNFKDWYIYYNEYLRRLKETKCDSTRVEMKDSIYYYPQVSPRSEPLLSPEYCASLGLFRSISVQLKVGICRNGMESGKDKATFGRRCSVILNCCFCKVSWVSRLSVCSFNRSSSASRRNWSLIFVPRPEV